MKKSKSKSKTMAKYVTAVVVETDVVAFVCSAHDVAALNGIQRKVKNGTSENGMS